MDVQAATDSPNPYASAQLRRSLRSVRAAVVALTFMCGLAYIALAIGAMLMLDIALPGRNGETVAGLLAMAIGTLALLIGGLTLRQRLLRQAGRILSFSISPVIAAHRYGTGESGTSLASDTRDIDHVRRVLTGGGIAALADLAIVPLYLIVLLMLGWPMALTLLIGGTVGAALLRVWSTTLAGSVDAADRAHAERDELLQTHAASRSFIRQLGILRPMQAREEAAERAALAPADALDASLGRNRLIVAALAAVVIIAVGTLTVWRATNDRAGIGTIAAALLLTGFALWPFREIAARQAELLRGRAAWARLRTALDTPVLQDDVLPLPTPRETLAAEAIAIAAAGERRVVLQGVSFTMTAGDITLIVGPSNSGKSMLLKALAGLAPNAIGNVRLDGATLGQYGETGRSRHIGYLSQSCVLLPGTISQNIAGFSDAVEPDAVVSAAQTTGAHDMIVRLPQGYDTLVGGPDCSLPQSARQRINITTAFYGDPFLLLLDTPDSFQDRNGQAALGAALQAARARGAIVLLTGESRAIIDAANLVLVLRKGGVADFGPKEAVRGRMVAREQIKSQPKPDAAISAALAE
ncbi:ATP-binding cassette domain-containing protein [Sphingomonas turrisvirgatae]|uniref:Uncharacterized protein n=1 Tax=Sphingomonas turrisvirgatae TaxID=1888892 RepID=A0A1E3LRV9_9SPHN|nr:ATP-binding cassette domain-containing protein [Sphingomonas turrisvirgatae]ODP36487.1 hypothetical protein BFL28_05735 [Sphingomonas turrisvirgatae]